MNDINDLHQYAGRGRPRVENPLTQAERAKAYRDRKRADNMVKSDVLTVTDNIVKSDEVKNVTENLEGMPSYGMLEGRIILLNAHLMQRSDELQAALDTIAALKAELISVTSHKKPKPKK